MKYRFTAALALSMAMAYAPGVTAQTTADANTVKPMPKLSASAETNYKTIFKAKTSLDADAVEHAPIAGLLEVSSGDRVMYMDPTGRWLFDGHLVDTNTKTSVTAIKIAALQKRTMPVMDWKSLVLDDAIKTTYGNPVPGRVLVTFEDPNCGFCKKLSTEFDKLKDITVYTYQISILGDASKVANQAIWCSKDRQGSWDAAMKGRPMTSEAQATCDQTALSRNSELAKRLGVKGTPAIFFADGSRIPGYTDAASIDAKVVSLASAKK